MTAKSLTDKIVAIIYKNILDDLDTGRLVDEFISSGSERREYFMDISLTTIRLIHHAYYISQFSI